MELQQALIIGGVVIIAILALDGWRRALKERRQQRQFDEREIDDDAPFDDGIVGEVRVLTGSQKEPSLDESALSGRGAPEPVLAKKNVSLPAAPELVISLSVIADADNEFNGPILFQQIVAMNFKFSELGIFHRYESYEGDANVQFSLANVIKPGTFNVNDISSFYTAGVCLFLTIPGPSKPDEAFSYMLEAAQTLARTFKGTVLDGERKVLTKQRIEEYRRRIQSHNHK